MPKTTLNLSPRLTLIQAEAEAMGISFPALLTADVVRFRQLAEAAAPRLSEWEWGLIWHVLNGREAHDILTGRDDLPTPHAIAAEIDVWADSALDDETVRAGKLRERVMQWSPLAVAGVLLRLRTEIAK